MNIYSHGQIRVDTLIFYYILASSVQKVKKRLLWTTDDVNHDILSTDQDCFNPTLNDFSSKYGISNLECQGDEVAKQIADPLELETIITSDKNENVVVQQGQMYSIPQNLAPNVNLSYCLDLMTLGSKLMKNSCWTFFQ